MTRMIVSWRMIIKWAVSRRLMLLAEWLLLQVLRRWSPRGGVSDRVNDALDSINDALRIVP